MAQTPEGSIRCAAKKAGISVEEYLQFQQQGFKRCTKCKVWKKIENFGKDRTRHDGLKAKCIQCCRVAEKKNMKGRRSPFKGKQHSDQAKRQMSKARQGNANAKGTRRTDEQKKFISMQTRKFAAKGEKHPRWKGGITFINRALRETAEARDWRRSVYERDSYTCQHCGDSRGGNLNAHHIKSFALYPELRYELSNGITLCEPCHQKVHYKPDSIRNKRKLRKSGLKFRQLSLF